jgi:hypothetical protein
MEVLLYELDAARQRLASTFGFSTAASRSPHHGRGDGAGSGAAGS